MTNSCERDARAKGPRAMRGDGIIETAVACEGNTEYFFTVQMLPGETPAGCFARAASLVDRRDAAIVAQDVFGVSRRDGVAALDRAFPARDWPITWIEDGMDAKPQLGGTQIWAVSGCPVTALRVEGELVGRVFEDASARYLRLGGLLPLEPGANPAAQSRDIFSQMERALAAVGMDFHNVVRTWFYNDRIVSWYPAFNQVRHELFRRWDVFGGVVPASTGIGAANGAGAALTAGLLAVARKDKAVRTFAVPSPLQCPALDYGSAFSRALEMDAPGHRRLFVSGTASIEVGGQTAHLDDVEGQMALTFRVVEAILSSRDMGWQHVVRALVYLKSAADADHFRRFAESAGLAGLPVLLVQTDICRDDLLVETELEAVAPK